MCKQMTMHEIVINQYFDLCLIPKESQGTSVNLFDSYNPKYFFQVAIGLILHRFYTRKLFGNPVITHIDS